MARPWDVIPPISADLSGRTVLVLHAHPDDEAIFTGATIHRLAAAGAQVVLVMATGGEQGEVRTALRPGESVRMRRLAELSRSARRLGVHRVVSLGLHDSGETPDPHDRWALAGVDVEAAARVVAGLALQHGADALVHYDEGGIYAHPDHLAVHRIGSRAAELARVTAYEATVDRGHDAGPHLVHAAAAGRPVGSDPAEITTVVSADLFALAAKRDAMAVHASQIDPAVLDDPTFDEVYGQEWFVRRGEPGVLDELTWAAPASPTRRLAAALSGPAPRPSTGRRGFPRVA